MTKDSRKCEIARMFMTGLRTGDASILRSIMLNEVCWSLPGVSAISGEALGLEAVLARARKISEAGMKLELKHILVGLHGVALSLHNTARSDHGMFDQHLATVLTMQGNKVGRIDTYLHDVSNANQFFIS